MEKITTQRGATRLLNFVKAYDPVARLVGDGSSVQVIRPDLDLGGEFIKLTVERCKTKLLLHDGAFTLGCLNSVTPDDLTELNELLSAYGADPLVGKSRQIQIRTSRADYPEKREDICRAIVAVELFFENRRALG